MKQICHRGNMFGPNPEMENKPEYIQAALNAGFDVEVDIWNTDNGFYLGHNSPTYPINRYFLQNQRIWAHCKTSKTFIELSKYSNINCFLQDSEDIVLTSRGNLWAHSNCLNWDERTVFVDLGIKKWENDKVPYAICSDYIVENSYKHQNIFDLLIIDIDGVMTDGTKIYGIDGKVFAKNYCDLDFTAIKRFISSGIKVCFLSGDKNNEAMANSRKIPFFHNPPGVDKTEFLPTIKKQFNAKSVAYVGDDYYDLAIMNCIEFPFCPKNAINAVKRSATTINIEGGKGVIAALYDMFEDKISYVFPVDSKDVNPK